MVELRRPGDRKPVHKGVESLIVDHLAHYSPGGWPVSITCSSRSIRRKNPSLKLSDAELDAMIERLAINQGLNVHFDHNRTD